MGSGRGWTGPLADLLPALQPEAMERLRNRAEPDKAWAWRMLPKGAIVALRVRGDMDMRRELRIARPERPEGAALQKWERELEIFVRHFKLAEGWHRQHVESNGRGIEARWIELREGEVEPGRSLLPSVPGGGEANCGGVGAGVRAAPGVHGVRDADRPGIHGDAEAGASDAPSAPSAPRDADAELGDMALCFLDIEGTGTDPYSDRIVELCIIRRENGDRPHTWRVNPGRPIPPGATEVHGITDADVADCPPFSAIAEEVQRLIHGAILVGYSLRKYDTPLLNAELRHAGQPGIDLSAVREIDLYEVWCQSEPRTLVGAARRFAGIDLEQDAHSAEADTGVLEAVLCGMARAFGIGDAMNTPADRWARYEELVRRSKPAGAMDRDGKFVRDEQGVVRLNFGQHRGEPAAHHPDFLEWILRRDFTAETKAVARSVLEETYAVEDDETEEFVDEAQGSFI